MSAVLPTLLWVGFLVYLVERLLPFAEQLFEARVLPKPSLREPVPTDLILAANRESEAWAREETLQHFRDLYDEHRDWNVVRGILAKES